MKQLSSVLILLSIFVNAYGQELHHNSDITNVVIDYDAGCMQKFDYQTDQEYIVEDNYTNFHIKIDDSKTFILKLLASTAPTDIKEKDMENHYELHCQSVANAVDSWFIYRVNHGGANIYLKLNSEKGKVIYKIDYVILREMDKEHVSYYAPPYFAFKYRYDQEHNPGSPIASDVSDARLFDMRYYLHGMTFQNEIRKDIFLKIYNDACHGRDYGVTTPLSPVGEVNPYLTSKTLIDGQKIIFRSCQHPIVVEVIKGVGLYKEYYQELDKTYMSKLISIDDIQIDEYLNLTAASLQEEKEFKNKKEEVYYATKSGAKRKVDASGNFIQPLTSVEQKEKAPAIIVDKKDKKQGVNPKNHIVQSGDTLYNISKKYKTSIDELKKMNNLTSNLIILGQELKVSQ